MKQETLEEAAEKFINKSDFNSLEIDDKIFEAIMFGAKWQQEKMYSEEEVYNLLCKLPNYFKMTIHQQAKARKEWFEQFKKK